MDKTEKQNLEITIKLLQEYGDAIRSDWSSIDGRQVRDRLDYVVSMLEDLDGKVLPLEDLRENFYLCPAGEGHWRDDCFTDCATGEGN